MEGRCILEALEAADVGVPEGEEEGEADTEAASPEPEPEDTSVATGGPGKTYLAPSSKT